MKQQQKKIYEKRLLEERKKILSRSIEGKCEKAQKLEMGWRFKAPVRLYKSRSEKG